MRVPGTAADALREHEQWDLGKSFDFDVDDWWFRTSFPAEPGNARLRFGGLATVADAWLNGEHVLHSENMFLAHDIDLAVEAQNELVVVCRSLRQHLAIRRPRPRWKTRLVEAQQLRWIRTSFLGRMTGWNPECAPVGPWRPVTVGPVPELAVLSLRARMTAEGGLLEVDVELTRDASASVWLELDGARAPMRVAPDGDGGRLVGALALDSIAPWFPATHGAPALHDAYVVVEDAGGTEQFSLGRVGFRSVEVDEGAGAWRLRVNGVAVFARGACWVPIDIVRLWTEPANLREELQRMVDAGCNMVRVLGIGAYEQSEFYELCDELGLMVWQDLMFANMDQPLDEENFHASVVAEVEQFLQAHQSHPSIVAVCGGSEVEQQAAMMGVEPAIGRNRVGRDVLPALAASVLPDVVTIPCSPSGGVFPFHVDTGVSHYYGVGAYLRPFTDARLAGVKFASECLAFSNVPSRESVDELLANAESPAHSPLWKQRVPRDRGAGWDFEDVRDHYVQELFGVRPMEVRYSDPDRYLDLGRAAVCIAIESALGDFRDPNSSCSGSLVFMQRDPWLGAGWGVVDAASRPKSAYWALRRAWAPRTVLLRDQGLNGLHADVVNDSPTAISGSLQFRQFAMDGSVLSTASQLVHVPAHSSGRYSVDAAYGYFRDVSYAYRFGPSQADVLEAVLEVDDSVVARAHYLPQGHNRERRADIGLRTTLATDGSTLTVASDQFAHFVSIDMLGATVSDNWFHLSPGDERVLSCAPSGGVAAISGEVRALNGYGARTIRIDGRPA
ncbi:MAG TPA: hypothetical protein PK020_03590 [Ilumatobacteraceae bacterium]|nr:hypothetical protein [Ilumatobacteraceae bacterium]